MKKTRTIITILALAAIIVSCKKNDDSLHITGFEKELADAVNTYRVSRGLNSLTHDYNIVSREAKAHSEGRANGTIPDNMVSNDLNERWQTIENKLGVNNVSNPGILGLVATGEITGQNVSQVAANVVEEWAKDPQNKEILEGNYTLQGPGEGKTSDGRTYITHIFCKFEQQ